MKDKPILFSTPMVKAILEGKKTQTRRILKLKKGDTVGKIYDDKETEYIICDKDGDEVPMEFVSPYGVAGDRLWVRETWGLTQGNGSPIDAWISYKAGGQNSELPIRDNGNLFDYPIKEGWRPSIFMPRWASRITLEVTEVIVQRLQNITEEDAQAEGFTEQLESEGIYYKSARMGFYETWNKLNSKRGYSWDSNPFVWAISFKVVK